MQRQSRLKSRLSRELVRRQKRVKPFLMKIVQGHLVVVVPARFGSRSSYGMVETRRVRMRQDNGDIHSNTACECRCSLENIA